MRSRQRPGGARFRFLHITFCAQRFTHRPDVFRFTFPRFTHYVLRLA